MIHTEILLPTELITHPDLKPQALRLITYILMQTDEDDRSFELNTLQWAKDLHCAASTIRRWMARLVELGVVAAKGIAGRVKHFFYAGFSRESVIPVKAEIYPSECESSPSPRRDSIPPTLSHEGRGEILGHLAKTSPSPRRDFIPPTLSHEGRGESLRHLAKTSPSPRRDFIPPSLSHEGRGESLGHLAKTSPLPSRERDLSVSHSKMLKAKKEAELRAFDATLPQAEKKIIIRRVCNRVSRELGYSDGTPEYLRLVDKYYREEVSWLKEMTF